MEITKLNGDSSWLFQFGQTRILLDPWLMDEQIDIAPWFNRQSHVEPCIQPENLSEMDAIVISHPFTDHCHEKTLKSFSKEIPLYAPASVIRIIKSWKHFKNMYVLNSKKPLKINDIEVHYLKSRRGLDLTHQALYFDWAYKGENIFYTPHGFWPSMLKYHPFIQKPVLLLISTFSKYDLPFYLGGMVNFGKENTLRLANELQARYIAQSHDEKKEAFGWVKRFARVEYCEDIIGFLKEKQSRAVFLSMETESRQLLEV